MENEYIEGNCLKRGGGGGVWGVYNVLWLASCIFKGVIKMKFFFAK